MRFAVCRPTDACSTRPSQILEQHGASWLKFADEYFCYTPDPAGAVAADALAASGFAIEEEAAAGPGPDGPRPLFLVTQEGRLFQRMHPDVPVLFDAGRYLVVALDPERAEAIVQDGASFALKPVPKNETIVDVVPRPAGGPVIDSRVQRIVDKISRPRFTTTLTDLVRFPTRHSATRHYWQAALQVWDRLATLGYRVRLEPVMIGADRTVSVVADKAGSASGNRRVTLVVAHLDSVNGDADDPALPAPGADDNASGSAGVIEIANVFHDEPIAQDLRLILFGGEEQGLYGSMQYLAQMPPADRKRINAVVNMDMIAVVNKKHCPMTVLLEGADPVSRNMIEGLAAAAHNYTNLEVRSSMNPYNSDHVPFIGVNVPAVLTIEGFDKTNKDVHNGNDTLDRINHDLMHEILRMNTAFVAEKLGHA